MGFLTKYVSEQVERIELSSPHWKCGVIAIIRHLQNVTTPWVVSSLNVNGEASPSNNTGVSLSDKLSPQNVSFYPTKLIKRPDLLLPPF